MKRDYDNEPGSVFSVGPAVLAMIFEGALGIIAILVGWLFSMYILMDLSLHFADLLFAVYSTLPLILAFFISLLIPFPSIRAIRLYIQRYLMPMFRGLGPFDLLMIALVSGIGEELLFRGLIQSGIEHYTGTFPAIVLAGILFGFVHFITPLYVIIASILGIYLGYLYFHTGNLVVPILVHALYNYIAFLYFKSTFRGEKKASV